MQGSLEDYVYREKINKRPSHPSPTSEESCVARKLYTTNYSLRHQGTKLLLRVQGQDVMHPFTEGQ